MKTAQALLTLIALLVAISAGGCAATPQDRWFQQRQMLNTANRVYLAHVPTMTDERIVHYGELLRTARAGLNEAREHLPEGGSDFNTTLDIIESLLARVIALDIESAAAPAISNTEDIPHDRR